MLDGGAPFYDVYTCSDGGWISVGCLEPQFYKTFLDVFNKSLPSEFSVHGGWIPVAERQREAEDWPRLKEYIEKGFMTNTRDYWTKVFHGKGL